MNSPSHGDVTRLLAAMREGDASALEELTSLVYTELRDLARSLLRRSPGGQTLRTTALVHEAYLKLVGQNEAVFDDHRQFYAFAARVMRNVLVDYARERKAAKRGGNAACLPLDEVLEILPGREVDILELNDAMERLALLDERKARVVELKFFGGQEMEEIARCLKVSKPTVERDWRMARAWLHRELTGSAPGAS